MTQDELMNQLNINNDINGVTTQEYAEAIGKPFLRIRAIIINDNMPGIVPKYTVLSDYMLLDTWTPVLDRADGLYLSSVEIIVLSNNSRYICGYKIDDNRLYITLTGQEKTFFENDFGNIGTDIIVVLYPRNQQPEE